MGRRVSISIVKRTDLLGRNPSEDLFLFYWMVVMIMLILGNAKLVRDAADMHV